MFADEEEAARAYDEVARGALGARAKLNFGSSGASRPLAGHAAFRTMRAGRAKERGNP
ncbi:MAG: hypothetical protein ABSE49_32430 [Polyangiaceae bacterium]